MSKRHRINDYENILSRIGKLQGDFSTSILTTIEMDEDRFPINHIVIGKGSEKKRVLISASIHGDEPAGVETTLRFIEEKHYQKHIKNWEIHIVPCVNPSGYVLGTRENHQKLDLNRQFKKTETPPEVAVMMGLLEMKFDLDVELHEDIDSPGYYLFQKEQREPISNLGRSILDSVEPLMPLNMNEEIEELPSERGLIARLTDPDEMDWWPMALYAHHMGCEAVFTLETSTDFPLQKRAKAHLKAIETVLRDFPGKRN